MIKIAFVCPYFGKMPNYFPLVLQSMRTNPSIDWIIFTDDQTKYNYPLNVKVNYIEFTELQKKINGIMPVSINLVSPYKLCDLRPFYGIIFKDYLKQYDFWGFCDFDCIFGNIRHFLTDNILNHYKKILFLGHMSLFINTLEMENIILQFLNKREYHKYLKLSNCSFQIDEIILPSFLQKKGIAIYQPSNIIIADICCTKKPFKICIEYLSYLNDKTIMKGTVIDNKGLVFAYNDGKLLGYSLTNNEISQTEYMYIHLQKRSMQCFIDDLKNFIIYPNKFLPYSQINKNLLIMSAKSPFIYLKRWKISYHYRVDPILRKIRLIKYDIFNNN